ncbi:hypothetical protein ES288_A09G165400v1 [Gossypium darwinii]|uniref:HVA22-like protein n=1 Tax=Gossypium darwinii TaxID=34276 RepID=A0A5D2FBC9_GOSDA|nr:hypothetical protein ES288_A09G165400v1 [Gossypium darwinii]
MLGEFIIRLLMLILGYAYPAFECFKTVEKNKVEMQELRFWCQYWILLAFLTVFERIGDIFISWLPMYGELKLTLLIYLWYPKTKGSDYVYDTWLRPYMARHGTEVDKKVQDKKSKKTINRSTAESGNSGYEIPDSPSHSGLYQALLKLRRTKPQN